MKPAALIFDVDGTLAETEELHRQAFNDAFAAFGLSWQWSRELYRELLAVTGGKERLAHFIAADPGRGALAARIKELHATKTERYTARMAANAVTLRPGVARLIAQAQREGVKLAIATTTSLPNVEALLAATLGEGAMDLFDVVGAGDMVAAKKPSPEIYHYVQQRLALPAGDCIAFEDSGNGLRSARAAGIPTVVTPGIYTQGEDFSVALAVLSDLGERDAPYRHLAGAGSGEPMVTLDTLRRWSGQA